MFARLFALAVVTFVSAAGCSSNVRFAQDLQDNQPLIAPGVSANAFLTYKQQGESSRLYLEWVDQQGKLVARSDDVAEKCYTWLDSRGLTDSIHEVRVERREFVIPFFGYPGPEVPFTTYGNDKAKIIVCLDPIVVVYGPGPIAFTGKPVAKTLNPLPGEKVQFFLGLGFGYGTRIPYAKDAIWFSPTLDRGPQPAEFLDENRRGIPVPWGTILLTRSGADWIVTSERKTNTEPKTSSIGKLGRSSDPSQP